MRRNRGFPVEELAARAYEFRPTVTDCWDPPLEVRARRIARSLRSSAKALVPPAPIRSR
jgi:hypothetical protein